MKFDFICPKCDKKFVNKQGLGRHLSRKLPCVSSDQKIQPTNVQIWDYAFSFTLDCGYNTTSTKFTDVKKLLSYKEEMNLRNDFLIPYMKGDIEETEAAKAIWKISDREFVGEAVQPLRVAVLKILKHMSPRADAQVKF